jgi:hypothetical protein
MGFIGYVVMGFLQKTLTVGFYEQRLLGVFIRENLSAFWNAERVGEIGVSSFSPVCVEVGFQPLKAGSLKGINLRVLGWVFIVNVGMGFLQKTLTVGFYEQRLLGVFAKNPYSVLER